MRLSTGLQSTTSLVLTESFVRITIEPALARLGGSNDWVASKSGMFAGMLVGGAVATESYPAFLAGAEMNPVGADSDALGAFKLLW